MTRGPVTTLAHWLRLIAGQKRLSLWLLALGLAGGLVMTEFDRLGLVYLVLFGFAASVVARWLVWIEENRFTPKGLRVGVSWGAAGGRSGHRRVRSRRGAGLFRAADGPLRRAAGETRV